MAEKIVVSVRVRPLNAKEEAKGTAWDVEDVKHAITPQVGAPPRHSSTHHTRASTAHILLYIFGGVE
jgi:hypothetical protein